MSSLEKNRETPQQKARRLIEALPPEQQRKVLEVALKMQKRHKQKMDSALPATQQAIYNAKHKAPNGSSES